MTYDGTDPRQLPGVRVLEISAPLVEKGESLSGAFGEAALRRISPSGEVRLRLLVLAPSGGELAGRLLSVREWLLRPAGILEVPGRRGLAACREAGAPRVRGLSATLEAVFVWLREEGFSFGPEHSRRTLGCLFAPRRCTLMPRPRRVSYVLPGRSGTVIAPGVPPLSTGTLTGSLGPADPGLTPGEGREVLGRALARLLALGRQELRLDGSQTSRLAELQEAGDLEGERLLWQAVEVTFTLQPFSLGEERSLEADVEDGEREVEIGDLVRGIVLPTPLGVEVRAAQAGGEAALLADGRQLTLSPLPAGRWIRVDGETGDVREEEDAGLLRGAVPEVTGTSRSLRVRLRGTGGAKVRLTLRPRGL